MKNKPDDNRIYDLYRQGLTSVAISGRIGRSVEYVRNRINAIDEQRNEIVYPTLSDADYERCSECGGLVQMPCFACRVRAYVNGESLGKSVAGPS